MKYYITSNRINIVLLVLLFILGVGSFSYNQYLLTQVQEQERMSIELWARALEYVGSPVHEEISQQLLAAASELRNYDSVPDSLVNIIEDAERDRTSQNFVTQQLIIPNRSRIPTVVTDEEGEIITFRDLEESDLTPELIERFARMNPRIEVTFGDEEFSQRQFIYYGESPTVRMLRYFPYIQFSLLALLLGIAYASYRTIARSEQSNLWVGMTKEAAHQLGTPLSSLYGWVELLREEKEDAFTQKICGELEKDITRLRGVAERFNKIGSEPALKSRRIAPLLDQVLNYMEQRLPRKEKNIEIRRDYDPNLKVRVNTELFQWAIENLVKNAIDSIKTTAEHAFVEVKTSRIENELMIDVIDSGIGIEKKYHQEIFKPGYSTKNRGWGLGLSLTKRIIEHYHKGKLFVLQSEPDKGSTIRVVLKLDVKEEKEE